MHAFDARAPDMHDDSYLIYTVETLRLRRRQHASYDAIGRLTLSDVKAA